MLSLDAAHAGTAVALGIGATLIMDLWNLFLRHAFGIASLNYCLLGRWISHMPTGTLRHRAIGSARKKPSECAVGWISHYTIGVGFAIAFIILASDDWLARPTILPALLFGLGTVVFPFFVMQPALGLGVASSKTRSPTQARLKSVVTHAIFGLGLYACALGAAYIRAPG